MNYLVILVGYEGIDKIVGLFDRQGAIDKITALRSQAKGWRVWSKDDKDVEISENDDLICVKPEQFCIMRVDANGAVCVCQELGVSLGKKWFY